MLRQSLSRGLARPFLSRGSICPRCSHTIRRNLVGQRSPDRKADLDTLNVDRLAAQYAEYHRTRQQALAAGAVAGVISIVYVCWKISQKLREDDGIGPQGTTRLDSALPPSHPVNDVSRKVIKHDEEGREVVATGNSTVPEFPRTMELPEFSEAGTQTDTPGGAPGVTSPTLIVPDSLAGDTEYTLVGLGTRSVSFLSINVYVLGYYIATADIAELQSRLVKRVNPIATTLVSTEKGDLRAKLLDAVEGEQIWEELLKSGVPARSIIRVVPVRDTDFPHLRDGFVRAIQAREGKATDEEFGEAMREFKRIFNRGKVPKRKEMLMLRDKNGKLTLVYDEGKSPGRQLLGTVDDERISRALWMNYLGGKKVASEEARKSIVDGIMEFVERPIGTVASQVL
ncbi:Altered inheritance of mitochondria protein 18, mitochondrial [Cytospora mali]|uniref:Altered inheritance of mitochondria protein 18, mitochondrial n=1 Tax=Cytospora mali TaxID=578113 RepID=A0A194VI66_CYTMA|nr:Altered inheritance of mitochondria protein 18, mitochondrial [Valsa mali]